MDNLLPWWSAAWEGLWERHRAGRLPHALLVTGPPGLGKRSFAGMLGQALLCQNPDSSGVPCGRCQSCTLFRAGTHPDFLQIEPADEGKAVSVDQIRHLCANLSLSSHAGGFKIAVVAPADRMNKAAANSLLKTLEEPSDNTLLTLVSEHPAVLPATIRSRCQQVRLTAPASAVALKWLQGQPGAPGQARLYLDLAAGAPLLALELAGSNTLVRRQERFAELTALFEGTTDVASVASSWAQEGNLESMRWFTNWVMDMIRLSSCTRPSGVRNGDLEEGLMGFADRLNSRQLYRLLDELWATRQLAATSVNRQLLVEDVLIDWARLGKASYGNMQNQVRP